MNGDVDQQRVLWYDQNTTNVMGGDNRLNRLKEFMERAGFTRVELADRSNCSDEAIRLLILDRRQPRLETARAIAKALSEALGSDVTADHIWPPETADRPA